MATRGSLHVGGKRYYISSDAYPSFARKIFKRALAIMKYNGYKKTTRNFIRLCNELVGAKWIRGLAPKSFKYPFEEYIWYVNLKKGTVRVKEGKPTTKEEKRRLRIIRKAIRRKEPLRLEDLLFG